MLDNEELASVIQEKNEKNDAIAKKRQDTDFSK